MILCAFLRLFHSFWFCRFLKCPDRGWNEYEYVCCSYAVFYCVISYNPLVSTSKHWSEEWTNCAHRDPIRAAMTP